MVHANVINNGVAAYYQARSSPQLMERLPELASYPYELGKQGDTEWGMCGPLWRNGTMALELHRLFVRQPELFAPSARGPAGETCVVFAPPAMPNSSMPGQGRFSINFFGARWAAWRQMASGLMSMRSGASPLDDEGYLTTQATEWGAKECIYAPLHVAHLSFYKQAAEADAALPW